MPSPLSISHIPHPSFPPCPIIRAQSQRHTHARDGMGASSSVAARQVTPLLLRALATMTGSLHTPSSPHTRLPHTHTSCAAQSSARRSRRSTRGSRTACPAATSPQTVCPPPTPFPTTTRAHVPPSRAPFPRGRVADAAHGRPPRARGAAGARRRDGPRAVHQRARGRAPLGRRQGLPARLLCARARQRRVRARRRLPPERRRLRQHRPRRPRRPRPGPCARRRPFAPSPRTHLPPLCSPDGTTTPSQCCTTCCATRTAP